MRKKAVSWATCNRDLAESIIGGPKMLEPGRLEAIQCQFLIMYKFKSVSSASSLWREPLVGSPLEIELLYFYLIKPSVPIPVIQFHARFFGIGLSIHCSSYNL
jgi:hypothetical protein